MIGLTKNFTKKRKKERKNNYINQAPLFVMSPTSSFLVFRHYFKITYRESELGLGMHGFTIKLSLLGLHK